MSYLRGLSSLADRSAKGSLRRISLCFPLIVLGVLLLTIVLAPALSRAQFQLWGEFPVENPFSVTTAVRGLNPPPGPGGGPPAAPLIRFEAIAGYFSDANLQNQFDYHGSAAIGTSEVNGPGRRRIDTRNPITFTDSGRQSAFDGFCCSNTGFGFDHDRSAYTVTEFTFPPRSFEIVIEQPEGATPRLEGTRNALSKSSTEGELPDEVEGVSICPEWLDDDDSDSEIVDEEWIEDVIQACLAWAASGTSTAGVDGSDYDSRGFDDNGAGAADSSVDGLPPPPIFTPRVSLPDCVTPSSNWHFTATGSGELREAYVGCVSVASFSFVIKRVSIDDFTVGEIPLASNVPIPSPIFTYLHTAACHVDDGVVIGSVLPRADLNLPQGQTTFFATKLDNLGVVQGTSSIILPGARPNKQAFFCREHRNFATFVYHGTGANPGETDTFVIQAGGTSAPRVEDGMGQAMSVWTMTENRETLWADSFPNKIGSDIGMGPVVIDLTFDGLEPVAEADADMAGGGVNSKVRYGGIEVPIMFADFETNDLRYWSSVQGN